MVEISTSRIDQNTDLVLFPESAMSVIHLSHKSSLDLIQKSILNNKTSLLTGLHYFEYGIDRERIHYNSIIHLNARNFIQSPDLYHKIKLVPLAEKIPLSSTFPILKSINIFKNVMFKKSNDNLVCFKKWKIYRMHGAK